MQDTHIKKIRNFIVAIIIAMIWILVLPDATVYAVSPDGKFTVVIDPGHGGHDTGAIDNGAKEKDINLSVSNKLAALIRKKLKDVNVVMTRSDDRFISLQERANIANRNHGDLFISVHTNSLDKNNANRKNVKGASVYALGLHKDDANLKVAQRENSVIELESDYQQKYSGFDPSKDESYIIFEMAQKKNLGQSLKFAADAQKQLVATAGRGDRGVKQAGFWVLWATSMPAVLVELDFICNPDVAAFLNSEDGSTKLAEALYNAVESYVTKAAPTQKMVKGGKPGTAANGNSATKPVATGNTDKTAKSGKGGKSRKQSASSKKKIEVSTPREVSPAESSAKTAVTTGGDSDIPILPGVDKGSKGERKHLAQNGTSQRKPQTTAQGRRRRSAAAKRVSDTRNIETAGIELRGENDYLAISKTKQEKVESKETEATSDKDAKSKKKSKKKNSSKKTGKKANKTIMAKDTTKKSGKERDKNAGKNAEKGKAGDKKTGVREHGGKKVITVAQQTTPPPAALTYKIQLLASEKQLATNDPAFCGLSPVSMFRENNLYKYTYGESADRREIEQLLLEVKSLIPDAYIIIR